MTAPDEAPEQRWRRTVDRRNRPAKLKVDRLLRDFGYAELDPEVGDAIEARLAGVALAVAPSLRDAAAGEVVTIYASDNAAPADGAAAPDPNAADLVAAEEEPAAASDVAQMVSYLKQQVLDARAEAERLRTELDRRIAARLDAERENEAIIAEQAAALEAQSRQLAELAAALDSTRRALAETRDEIRRAVGELQALPVPVPADSEAELLAADEAATDDEEDSDEFDVGDEEWAEGRADAAAAAPVAEPLADDDGPADDLEDLAASASDLAAMQGDDVDEPALTVVESAPAVEPDEPAPVIDEAPVEAPDPAFDLDEPALGVKKPPAEEPDLAFDLDEPALGAERAPAAEVPDPLMDLDEPAPQTDEFELEPPPRAAETPAPDAIAGWQPEIPSQPPELETGLHAVRDPDDLAPVAPPVPEAADDLDAPLPPDSEWLPVDLRPPSDAGAAASDSAAGARERETELTDFDDFLYDAEELYDPGAPARAPDGDALLESEIEARWADEPAVALPPPPPAPPSPFGDEPAPEPADVAERATRGKAGRGRGRGGRGRGRWEGSCSICGREPQVNRRKDLQAAGWDLDDDAAACPQCRGVG